MEDSRPLILLSNDDGYAAENLRALHQALTHYGRVIVCAPEVNQSATSHSLSLHRPLRLRNVSEDVFAIDGTPADCVYVAMHSNSRVLPRKPDLVVSGMNHGLNLGVDVFYSGTVAAAREAAMRGVPAVAVSADAKADRAAAAALGARIAMEALAAFRRTPSARAPLFNVNVPPGNAWPVRATKLGARLYTESVIFREDPRGQEYLWIGGGGVRHDHVHGSDTEAFDEGAVGVTPLTQDLTSSDHRDLCVATCAAVSLSKREG
ncbi:5'/3'-nucleotidase SurE [Polyangium mundeleinium]|uniref:5'-nucleotidase SurE n=1 Tax=Polyangium mundeleinium TaxID=2995306 RepID=A0ABT5EYM5_9BACT|nr:5'/3'-nucleotidase SurE [Polyangium mundeleinium]MDC0746931.1 5'/3'-nucleotidase SurE [Polyangium mundeleinium]